MWLPDLADAVRVENLLTCHRERLGIPGDIAAVTLVDVRLTHPHRPESPLCRGWATYLVTPVDSAPVLLYLKGFPDRATSEAAWRQDRPSRPGGRSDHLAGEDVVVWRFPEDPSLPALPDLLAPRLRPADVPPAVTELFLPASDELRASVVRYQPEASATLLVQRADRARGVEAGGPTAFAKHLPHGSVTAHASPQQALWAMTGPGVPLRIAEPLACDPVRSVLWTRGVPGRPLTAVVPPAQLPDVARPTGALLAALHGSGVAAGVTVSVDGTLAEMRKKAAKLARAHRDVAAKVAELVATATRRGDDVARERRCTLHGDFHLDQLVTSAEGPVLVDLDSMVNGPPEVDLAEFLVDLGLRGLPRPVAEVVSRELLSSYTATGGEVVDAAVLEVCADAEFLNRCYRHLRRHTPGWQLELEEELGRHDDVSALLQR